MCKPFLTEFQGSKVPSWAGKEAEADKCANEYVNVINIIVKVASSVIVIVIIILRGRWCYVACYIIACLSSIKVLIIDDRSNKTSVVKLAQLISLNNILFVSFPN